MTCEIADGLIEAVAAGASRMDGELAAHLEGCARCRRAMVVAREVETLLRAQSEPASRPELLAAILTRIRRERWRTEQSFDLAFNLVTALVLVCVLGAAYLLMSAAGIGGLSSGAVTGLANAMRLLVERARPLLAIYGLASVLLTMTLGVWWWAERGFEL